jgi:hypothetical protein
MWTYQRERQRLGMWRSYSRWAHIVRLFHPHTLENLMGNRRFAAVLIATTLTLPACFDLDDKDDTGEPSTEDTGLVVYHALSVEVSGALSVTVDWDTRDDEDVSCFAMGDTDMMGMAYGHTDGSLSFSLGVLDGGLGIGDGYAATVAIPSYTHGEEWVTPELSCVADITRYQAITELSGDYFQIEGNGSCSSPALPTIDEQAAPVTIGDFDFAAFIGRTSE